MTGYVIDPISEGNGMKTTEDHDEYILMTRIEFFVRKWSPPDRQSEFDADLFMLVRAIHADAAKPYGVTMTKVLEAAVSLVGKPK